MNTKIEEMLVDLAEKLGTTVEHLWEVLLKQSVISGVTDFFVWVIFFLTCCVFSFLLLRNWKQVIENNDGYEDPLWRFIPAVIAFVLLFTGVFGFDNVLTKIINPEYWALKEVMKFIN